MDIITANVELSNPRQPQLHPLEVSALVDTGAMTICIPEHVALQLQLPEIEKREVTTADERSHLVPYVGPIQIRFQNRTCFTGALVLGDTVLLGAVPIEDMDLVISPSPPNHRGESEESQHPVGGCEVEDRDTKSVAPVPGATAN